jgi:hypothetical protein
MITVAQKLLEQVRVGSVHNELSTKLIARLHDWWPIALVLLQPHLCRREGVETK